MPCALVFRPGGFTVEVARGQVQALQKTLHYVEVRQGYAVIQVDLVHTNFIQHKLEIPPNDEITDLGEALL